MKPRIDAIGVVAKDLKETLAFYELLGFDLKQSGGIDHYEATQENGLRLMIDTEALLKRLGQPEARPASFANFAILWQSSAELDTKIKEIKDAGYKVVLEPQDMFWGQRYATIKDPNGNRIDMFAWLLKTP